jgi:NAD(P)H-dependent FMN reductase
MTTARLLAFAGSTRDASFNKQLLRAAVGMAEGAGATVTTVELRDLALPLFDGDLEAASGLPDGATRLKALMVSHHGFLIAAPEYNSSITGVLKNAIDWASRAVPGEAPLVAFREKTAALLSASPGALGGLRGLVHLRAILSSLDVLVIPEQFALGKANEAFDGAGALKDPKQAASVKRVVERLWSVTKRLSAPA